ncbi:MAG TPA: urease accessory protein UreD [Amycolatopsis sp.]|nr:urease accessory protein UreD [Amycolatopsis sp.]
MHLVQAAGGPVGGDQLGLDVSVAAGRALRVCSAAATIAHPGPHGDAINWAVSAAVDAGAELRWNPLPTVVVAGARYHCSFRADVAPDGLLVVREEIVLGRHGEPGGEYRGTLAVTVGDRPLIAHTTMLDGADHDLSGPAGSGGHRVLGSMLVATAAAPPTGLPTAELVADAGIQWSVLPLDGPGYLILALADTANTVRTVLDRCEALIPPIASAAPGPAGAECRRDGPD